MFGSIGLSADLNTSHGSRVDDGPDLVVIAGIGASISVSRITARKGLGARAERAQDGHARGFAQAERDAPSSTRKYVGLFCMRSSNGCSLAKYSVGRERIDCLYYLDQLEIRQEDVFGQRGPKQLLLSTNTR